MWMMVQSQRMLSLRCPPQAFCRNTGWGKQNWVFVCMLCGVCQQVSSITYSQEHRDRAFKFFFVYWRIIALQYCVGLCHSSSWSATGIHISPPSRTLLPSPTPPHPSGLSQSTGLSSLCHTANSYLLSTLHLAMYIFPCYSLNSSHPLLPQLCPQVFSLCLHLHCCPANRLISTVFLDSIYMC